MSYMFYACRSITSIEPLANWNTSKVTNMSYLLGDNSSNVGYGIKITSIEPLANWNTSKVTNMSGLFRQCINITYPLAELNQCVLNPAYGFVVNVIDVL